MSDLPIKIKVIVQVLLIFTAASLCWKSLLARDRLGSVEVSRGSAAIIRNGESVFVPAANKSDIRNFDLLISGEDTSLNWQVDPQSKLQLGANGLVVARPWKRAGDAGYLALTYGAAKLTAEDERVVRSPAAVIRYSGSVLLQVTVSGNTMVTVLQGKADVSDQSGKTRSVTNGQTALVINAEIVIPDAGQLSELNITDSVPDMPPLNSQAALSFTNERDLLGAGVLSTQQLQDSRQQVADTSLTFDAQVAGDSEAGLLPAPPRPLSSEMASDLEALYNTEAMEVEAETDELGTIRVLENRPDNVFSEFSEPKSPGRLFDLDDKTSWTLESGLILVTFEK